MSTPRILILDDDAKLAAMLVTYLEKNGFAAEAVGTPSAAMARLQTAPPDLLVLDLGLPEQDGLEVCRQLRARSALPILMLTGRGDEADRIVGLELGADDYLGKPFNPRELVARVRSILRRVAPLTPAPASTRVLRFPRMTIDADRREVRVVGAVVTLTSTEFDLLFAMALSAGIVLSRDVLLSKLRGARDGSLDRTIDVHISHLRQKLEVDPKSPRALRTVWGEGYVFTGE